MDDLNVPTNCATLESSYPPTDRRHGIYICAICWKYSTTSKFTSSETQRPGVQSFLIGTPGFHCWLVRYQIACAGSFPIGVIYCSCYFLSKCTGVKLSICVRLPDLASSHVPASKPCDRQASHVTVQYSDMLSYFTQLTLNLHDISDSIVFAS